MKLNKETLSNLKTTQFLAHHDVVFRAPVCDPIYGLPLGNGSMGLLLHLSEERLHIQINHTDLLDDIAEVDYYDHKEDETHSVVRNGAEFVLDFGCPLFDTIYQNAFESRLSLADATALISADTPFCKAEISAFVSEGAQSAVVSLDLDAKEALALRAVLKRWGSRTFQFWYGRYDGDASIGLRGSSAQTDMDGVCVTQALGKQYFSVAVLPKSGVSYTCNTNMGHTAEMQFAAEKKHTMDFYIAFGFGTDAKTAQADALARVRAAAESGRERLYANHCSAWDDFWNQSYVALPNSEDFIENLWYLNLYYANCELKGKYPPHFCNGIWGFNHDFVPWNLYFHYNTQHMMNALSATNHPELLKTYFDFRKAQLPQAKHAAQVLRGGQGAHYSDICDMAGRMMLDKECLDNCTCGAQIALLMYKHYRYTGNEHFLRETVLPILREIGAFYLDLLKPGEDGKYHISNTSAYEGSPCFDDCITDLVHIRALFKVLAEVLEETDADCYKERFENLADFTAVELDADETEDDKFINGIGRGRAAKGNKVLTVGKLSDPAHASHRVDSAPDGSVKLELDITKPMRKTFGTPKKQAMSYYGFPDAEMSPIYPAGLVGIKNKDTPIYDMIYNSIMMHSPALEKRDAPSKQKDICMAWCMMPIYMARMGLAADLKAQLMRTVSTWIVCPQGFGADASNVHTYLMRWESGRALNIRGKYGEEVIRFNHEFFLDKPELFTAVPHWKFRRFNYETLPIIACAVNEMLMQSYDGTLRLFAAVEKGDECAFKLAAEGGFLVSAVYKNGEFTAEIESRLGGELRIVFENVDGKVSFADADGTAIDAICNGDAYFVSTQAGMKLYASSAHGASIELVHADAKNMDVKTLGDAKLGTQKEF